MALNMSLLHGRFDDIRRSLDRLEALAHLPREAFLADQDVLDIGALT